MSDYPFVKQLHADRTARITSEGRRLHLPTRSLSSRFSRRANRRHTATRLAASC